MVAGAHIRPSTTSNLAGAERNACARQPFSRLCANSYGTTPVLNDGYKRQLVYHDDPLKPQFTVLVSLYEKRWGSAPLRWRAQRIGDWRVLAKSDKGCSDMTVLLASLKVLWPNGSHLIVKFLDGTLMPFDDIVKE